MKKCIIGLIVFCVIYLSLFIELAYLLAHINPPRIHPLPPLPDSPAPEKKPTKPSSNEAKPPESAAEPNDANSKPPEDSQSPERLRRRNRDRPFELYSYKRGTDEHNNFKNTSDVLRQSSVSNNNATNYKGDQESISEPALNTTLVISSVKGFRRSIETKRKEDPDYYSPASILLKVMDDRGKPRLEILIGKSGDTEKNSERKNRSPKSNTKTKFYMLVKGDNNTVINKADESKPTMIKVMPNNSLVVNDPDDLSNYPDDRSHNSTEDLMKETFETKKLNSSRIILNIKNSIHDVEDNFTNFETSAKYLDKSYAIKVRFDNKTEIIGNDNIIKIKQNFVKSDVNLTKFDITENSRNISQIRI